MSIVGIYLAPLIHYPMVTIDAQDADGNKVILHFVEGKG